MIEKGRNFKKARGGWGSGLSQEETYQFTGKTVNQGPVLNEWDGKRKIQGTQKEKSTAKGVALVAREGF